MFELLLNKRISSLGNGWNSVDGEGKRMNSSCLKEGVLVSVDRRPHGIKGGRTGLYHHFCVGG